MDIVKLLKKTSSEFNLDLEETTITDTIEEVGPQTIELLVHFARNANDPYQAMTVDAMLRKFFTLASKRQKIRDTWKAVMDPNNPLDMFVDQNGDLVFKEVS
jgi:hypothetical protein